MTRGQVKMLHLAEVGSLPSDQAVRMVRMESRPTFFPMLPPTPLLLHIAHMPWGQSSKGKAESVIRSSCSGFKHVKE